MVPFFPDERPQLGTEIDFRPPADRVDRAKIPAMVR
jgi:hypothetical protein